MRRSKSKPSKYIKNYKKVSQRRMTSQHDNYQKEEEEIQKSFLKESLNIVTNSAAASAASQRKMNQKKKDKRTRNDDDDDDTDDDDNKPQAALKTKEKNTSNKNQSEEQNYYDKKEYLEQDDLHTILPPKQKKAKSSNTKTELSTQEIKEARKVYKSTQRKLKNLTKKKLVKEKRTTLYKTLETHAISSADSKLLSSSAFLNKKRSKKEELAKILQKKKVGLDLSTQEEDLLYNKFDVDEEEEERNQDILDYAAKNNAISSLNDDKNKKLDVFSNKSQQETCKEDAMDEDDSSCSSSSDKDENDDTSSQMDDSSENKTDDEEEPLASAEEKTKLAAEKPSSSSFASMIMANLTSLKTTTDSTNASKEPAVSKEAASDEALVKYVPTAPSCLQTPYSLNITSKAAASIKQTIHIERPNSIKQSRLLLPILAMEYEIMDKLAKHDVVLLCSETGSGKSTQVVQFLYESGEYRQMIGITQPRRVAAISTAKRVSYEMGFSPSGDKIPPKNTVAYQTRYETSGLSAGKTNIKFMTDGILLQEIQHDLLLRSYSVIVLDEAHERNLNTDVLIGLLSKTLVLRREAHERGELGIFKIVIMSATLRIEDFRHVFSNDFSPSTPMITDTTTTSAKDHNTIPKEKEVLDNVITVPGRTYPVTIHHSKETELDDYVVAAYTKICKIHTKLMDTDGGILVFLTGKNEIYRLQKLLLQTFEMKGREFEEEDEVAVHRRVSDSNTRELDDEDIDADVFDDFNAKKDSSAVQISKESKSCSKGVYILPLHSMLSSENQSKVFNLQKLIPPNHRLIVLATNIAETSITIPGISYVVDTGRVKQRSFAKHNTSITSYNVLWISKASANQRAGRAGRLGPGHCYRLYSSSVYTRYFDDHSIPEILIRPMDDVVLSLKSMNIRNIHSFPFPTIPNKNQIISSLKLLCNIGCVTLDEGDDDDGCITPLGREVASLPLGVRYGKILLMAYKLGDHVLDYAIMIVAIMSESNIFMLEHQHVRDEKNQDETLKSNSNADNKEEEGSKNKETYKEWKNKKWLHKYGDVFASIIAVGAYSYQTNKINSHNAATTSKLLQSFCRENKINYVIVQRIQKLRRQLSRLIHSRLHDGDTNKMNTSTVMFSTLPPPTPSQEKILLQAFVSGMLDNVARKAPPGTLTSNSNIINRRSAYLSCASTIQEPLYIDQNSVLHSTNFQKLPEWVCYESIVRKQIKRRDGSATTIAIMKNMTLVNPDWLGKMARGSPLLKLGTIPLEHPMPSYDTSMDAIICCVETKYGHHSWPISPISLQMSDVFEQTRTSKRTTTSVNTYYSDDSYRWFARLLLEGKIIPELHTLPSLLNDPPSIITRKKPVSKVALLVSALSSEGIDTLSALKTYWITKNDKFLFRFLKSWTKDDCTRDVKVLWIKAVKATTGVQK